MKRWISVFGLGVFLFVMGMCLLDSGELLIPIILIALGFGITMKAGGKIGVFGEHEVEDEATK